jgi:hypothetical protein
MDRTDAIRLLESLVAAGMNTRAPKANAWIEKKALQIGLEGNQFVSALAYAGNEGWLADAPRKGWTSLTRAGEDREVVEKLVPTNPDRSNHQGFRW